MVLVLVSLLYWFLVCLFVLMIRRPPRSTRTDTLFPTRRSSVLVGSVVDGLSNPGFCAVRLLVVADRPGRCRIHPVVQSRLAAQRRHGRGDRKSTRLNSSH